MAAALLSSLLVSCKKEAVDVEVIRQMPDKVVVNPAQIPGATVYKDVVYTAGDNVRVEVGSKIECPVKVYGDVQLVYTVKDPGVASVSQDGYIEALSEGTTSVSVNLEDKDVIATIEVECYAASLPSITIGKTKIYVTSAEYNKNSQTWFFHTKDNVDLKFFPQYGSVYFGNDLVAIPTGGFSLDTDEANRIVTINISAILSKTEEAILGSISIPYDIVKD